MSADTPDQGENGCDDEADPSNPPERKLLPAADELVAGRQGGW
jgi:hypothetical protein